MIDYGPPPGGWTDEDRASWTSCIHLEQMRDWWQGSDCVVVAGGPSAKPGGGVVWEDFGCNQYDVHWTIACNRTVEFCSPDFAACFEPRKDRDVWACVKAQPIPFILSHRERDHPRVVLTPDKETMKQNAAAESPFGQSPFYAMYCAITLGFSTIGVIGLDLTRDRYNAKLGLEEQAYGGLVKMAANDGSRVINLNPDSRLRAIPTGTWEEVRRK